VQANFMAIIAVLPATASRAQLIAAAPHVMIAVAVSPKMQLLTISDLLATGQIAAEKAAATVYTWVLFPMLSMVYMTGLRAHILAQMVTSR
jgi:hypothetical protein